MRTCIPIALVLALAPLCRGQTISSLSAPVLHQAGRLFISGAGFGPEQGTSQVLIEGVPAPIASWRDHTITAYIPDAVAPGTASVQVVTSAGPSNSVSLQVTLRPPPSGHVLWRFMADSDRIESRSVLAPDGTIYFQDLNHLYSLSPSGGVNWIFTAQPGSYYGRLDRGSDGTLYAGFGNKTYAVRPDGTLRWVIADPMGAAIIAGPSVGPDGNIYATTNDGGAGGLGLYSVTPEGDLRWNQTGFLSRYGYHGEPVLFGEVDGSPRLFFSMNVQGLRAGTFFSFDLEGNVQWERLASGYPALGPGGELYAFTNGGPPPQMTRFDPASGDVIWNRPGTNSIYPEAGPDGTLYCGVTTIGGLKAITAPGSQLWSISANHPANGGSAFIYGPAVSPQNHLLLHSGYAPFAPGFFAARSPETGALLWSVILPTEGVYVWPSGFDRARFTPDGRTAYIGSARADYGPTTTYCYLYALDTSDGLPPECPADFDGSGAVASADITAFLSAWFSDLAMGSLTADFDGSGMTNSADITSFLGAWFSAIGAGGC